MAVTRTYGNVVKLRAKSCRAWSSDDSTQTLCKNQKRVSELSRPLGEPGMS